MRALFSTLASLLLIAGFLGLAHRSAATSPAAAPAATVMPAASAGAARAIFAGGCFWCMEGPFEVLDGVIAVRSGYTGGHVDGPTYEQVSAGGTGHTEAVEVLYDAKKVKYERLLEIFWHNIDPLAKDFQFCDRGTQYRSGIFHMDDAQKAAAESSKKVLEASGRFAQPIVTEITKAGPFYVAEEYHQDYYLKNPVRYKFYRGGCGRDARLKELWGESAGH